MGAKKSHDLAVKVGEYIKAGKTKGRYQNIGALFTHSDGSMYLLIDRWFNPAGVPKFEGKGDALLVSVFAPKDRSEQSQKQEQGQAGDGNPPPPDDDVPF